MPYKDHADKRAYNREYKKRDKDRFNTQQRARYARNPAPYLATAKRWVAANLPRLRPMQRAKTQVWRAIKRGLLVRPTECSACHVTGYIEAAHADYTRPLDVVWLCRRCHRAWDHASPKSV